MDIRQTFAAAKKAFTERKDKVRLAFGLAGAIACGGGVLEMVIKAALVANVGHPLGSGWDAWNAYGSACIATVWAGAASAIGCMLGLGKGAIDGDSLREKAKKSFRDGAIGVTGFVGLSAFVGYRVGATVGSLPQRAVDWWRSNRAPSEMKPS